MDSLPDPFPAIESFELSVTWADGTRQKLTGSKLRGAVEVSSHPPFGGELQPSVLEGASYLLEWPGRPTMTLRLRLGPESSGLMLEQQERVPASEEPALSRECGECGAKIGGKCRDEAGAEVLYFHGARFGA